MGNRNTNLLKISVFVLMIFLVLPIAIAQSPVYEQNEDITLSIPCTINGSVCSVSSVCSCTIINPESLILINNQNMVKNGGVFEINLTSNQTSVNGQYELNVVCSDLGNSNSKFLTFSITPNGEIPTTAKGILYAGLIILFTFFFALSIYGAMTTNNIILKMTLYLVAYLLLIGTMFISWNLSLDYLTSSPFLIAFFRILFYFLLIALFPTILVLFIYMMYMMTQISTIQSMLDKGVPIDEAYEREVKRGFGSASKW